MSRAQTDIGVAMIAKDSAEHIARAVQSVRNIARQIVVVDTGSADCTPEIAVAFGAEVHFHQWREDFSEARNYALRAMRTAWILQLDTDEELLPEGIASVFEVISDAKTGGASVRIINELAGGTQSEHTYTRLFRNHASIRYTGAIHEQIAPSALEAGFAIRESQLVIRHYGYVKDTGLRANRNTTLLKKELTNAPDDVWLQYHLAMSLFAEKKYGEAETYFAAIRTSEHLTEEQRELSHLRAAQSAIALDAPGRSGEYLEFRSAALEREGLRQYLQGLLHGINRDFKAAALLLASDEVRNSKLVNQSEARQLSATFASLNLQH